MADFGSGTVVFLFYIFLKISRRIQTFIFMEMLNNFFKIFRLSLKVSIQQRISEFLI